jgi:hypothetical protein
VFPPLFPPPPPPHPIAPKAMEIATNTHMASQARLRRGPPMPSINANAVPVDGHSSFLNSFPAVVGAVVAITSVEFCAEVPVIVTELGERLHVGELVATADVMEQVRATVPAKPFDGVTVSAIVLPVVAPGATLMVLVSPPITKVGAGTLRVAEAVIAEGCTGLPDAVIGIVTDSVPWPGEDTVRLLKAAPAPPIVVTGPRPAAVPGPLYSNVTGTPPMFWPFSVTVTTGAGFTG